MNKTKTIVCFGDSNTWGFIPVKERGEDDTEERFPANVRWSGALAKLLGKKYHVVEEGLNGRTTALNDVVGKYRNGAKYLGVCLTTNKPIDLLVIMLGGNDTKRYFRESPQGIAKGVEKLIKIACEDGFGPGGEPPKILLIAPTHIREEVLDSWVKLEFDKNSIIKSKELAALYYDVAKKHDCYYMNAAVYAEANEADGLHLDAENHAKLAEAVSVKIKEIFE